MVISRRAIHIHIHIHACIHPQRKVLEEKLGRGFRCIRGDIKTAIHEALSYMSPSAHTAAGESPKAELCSSRHVEGTDTHSKCMHAGMNTENAGMNTETEVLTTHGGMGHGSDADDTCMPEPESAHRQDVASSCTPRARHPINSDSDSNKHKIVMIKLTPDGVPIDTYLRSLKAQDGTITVREMIVMLGDDRGLSEADLKSYEETAADFGVPITPVSLGGAMLLASHCIVLVQHYIDVILHTCPAKLWERPPREVVQLRKKAQRRKKRRNKEKKNNTSSNQATTVTKTSAQTTLTSGQNLGGQNLSGQNLSGQILSGAVSCCDREGDMEGGGEVVGDVDAHEESVVESSDCSED